MRCDPPALQIVAAPAGASHGHQSPPRQSRSHGVQMFCHRLYFSPSIAGLNALAIGQPKREGRGLHLLLSAFPVEYALRTTGPSFSILANTEGCRALNHISLAFPLLLRTSVQLPGVKLQHQLTLTREMRDAGTQRVDSHTPPI